MNTLEDAVAKMIHAQWETVLFYLEPTIGNENMPSRYLSRKEQLNKILEIPKAKDVITEVIRKQYPHFGI